MKNSFEDQHGTTENLRPIQAKTLSERLEADRDFQAAKSNPGDWRLRQAAHEYERSVREAMAAPERHGDPGAGAELGLLVRDQTFLDEAASHDSSIRDFALRHWRLVWRKARPYSSEAPNPVDYAREVLERQAAPV